VLLVLGLSLAIQAISLSAMGLGVQVFSTFDSIQPPSAGTPSGMQKNIGFITYILIAASISCLLYIYLLIGTLINKSISQFVDWCGYLLIVCFQFGIAVVFAVDVTNGSIAFLSYQSLLQTLQSMGTTGPLVDDLCKKLLI
jgi:hypothetical protein